MILEHSHDLKAFRQAVRQWVHQTVPPDTAETLSRAKGADYVAMQQWWMAERHKVGLATPHWPKAYGGADLTLSHQIVIADEITRANAPNSDLFMISLNHVPGTLIPMGTEGQKREHLPKVAQGAVWCQGFSEPGAGSDLAALRTRAEHDDGHYVVNGQKIWSTYSMHADWCLLLTRTDFEARKQLGITFLLLDMKTPGVEVRPIKKSTGSSFFGEIFLTDVRIPMENRVGAENAGWAVAQATLASERGVLVFDAMERIRAKLERFYATAIAENAPWLADDELRRQFMTVFGDLQALRRQIRGLLKENEDGGGSGWSMTPAFVKLVGSSLRQRLADLQVRIFELGGQIVGSDHDGGAIAGAGMYDYLDSYGFTISAGSNEIMRNLIAERGLGLPRG